MNLDTLVRLVSPEEQESSPEATHLPAVVDPALNAPGWEGAHAVFRHVYADFLNEEGGFTTPYQFRNRLVLEGRDDQGNLLRDDLGTPYVAHIWHALEAGTRSGLMRLGLYPVVPRIFRGAPAWWTEGVDPLGSVYMNRDSTFGAGIVFRSSAFSVDWDADGTPTDFEPEFTWNYASGGPVNLGRNAPSGSLTIGGQSTRYNPVSTSGVREDDGSFRDTDDDTFADGQYVASRYEVLGRAPLGVLNDGGNPFTLAFNAALGRGQRNVVPDPDRLLRIAAPSGGLIKFYSDATAAALLPFAGAGKEVWALRLDSTGAQFDEVFPPDESGQGGRTVTRVRLDSTWLIRWRGDLTITPFWALVDNVGDVWDLVAVREVGRRRHLQLDCTRVIDDPRAAPAPVGT